MGFQAVKKYYDIKHIVAVYDKRDFGGPCICIGSAYVHDLIAIRITDGKIFYSSIVRRGEGSDIGRLSAQIEADKENGILRGLIDTPDVFTRNLPVFTIKDWAVVADYCEEYGWPNTTNSGYIMYENTYFKTRAEAYTYLLKDTAAGVRCCNFRYNFREGCDRIKHAFRLLFRECWFWVAARTVGRFRTKKNIAYENRTTCR